MPAGGDRSQERTTERPKRRRNKQQLQFPWLSAVITVLILGCVVYEEIYCSRGDMENRIKECQLDLHFGDDAALCRVRGLAINPMPTANAPASE